MEGSHLRPVILREGLGTRTLEEVGLSYIHEDIKRMEKPDLWDRSAAELVDYWDTPTDRYQK